jgi:hypothetical protein
MDLCLTLAGSRDIFTANAAIHGEPDWPHVWGLKVDMLSCVRDETQWRQEIVHGGIWNQNEFRHWAYDICLGRWRLGIAIWSAASKKAVTCAKAQARNSLSELLAFAQERSCLHGGGSKYGLFDVTVTSRYVCPSSKKNAVVSRPRFSNSASDIMHGDDWRSN